MDSVTHSAEKDAHAVTVTYQHAWAEYLPKCACGWVGSYTPSRQRAEAEADEHHVIPPGKTDEP
jgi:hypothetical protein